MLVTSEPQVAVSLSLVKDTSLNLRRDHVEEKESMIKQGITNKIREVLPKTESPLQFDFKFSVMTDDGNLQSALVAGVNDLLKQTGKYCEA